MNEDKCPICGGKPTKIHHGDILVPFAHQVCCECDLPCRHWGLIANMEAERDAYKECVELYADKNHWSTRDGVFIHPDYNCGYEPAQAALRKVGDMPATTTTTPHYTENIDPEFYM